MRVFARINSVLAGALAVGLLLITGGCATVVRFPTASPRPLTLSASLYRPEGDGPFPAVVLLHSCEGPKRNIPDWAALLRGEGYVILAVDSLSPRGATTCQQGVGTADVVGDAFGALAYLRTLPFVDAARIGVMGTSRGGRAALQASRASVMSTPAYHTSAGFRAAVALYPAECASELGRDVAVPLLILLGGADDLAPPHGCVIIAKELQQAGRTVVWKVYPGATHAFDERSLPFGGFRYSGHTMRYDSDATRDAAIEVRDFLARHLREGGPAPR
ncbi:MAG: dienelactone hydrolase family protein [Candidatus Rokubacteria bacterium]|nr:dienelactone hydrolase family protein [Candidatus Rokubacteria bacterium]